MNKQNILEEELEKLFENMEHFITPRDEIKFKQFVLEALSQQKAELKKLITEEIVTCQKTGEPTSRLTSLYNKI